MTLLEKLDWLMKKYDLNKNTLSKKSNIAYTTIDSLYKKGYSNAKLSTLLALARYFNVSLDYLVNDKITNPRHGFDEIYSEKELRILDLYRNADDRTKKIVEMTLDYDKAYSAEMHIMPIAARPNTDTDEQDYCE